MFNKLLKVLTEGEKSVLARTHLLQRLWNASYSSCSDSVGLLASGFVNLYVRI